MQAWTALARWNARRAIRRAITGFVVVVLGSAALSVGAPRAAAAPVAPQTVPSAQSWMPGGSAFTVGERPRVHFARADLRTIADDLAAELEARIGRPVHAEPGVDAAPGDIVLRTGRVPDAPDTAEAYRISIAETLELQGADLPGVFYATRSVLQMLRRSGTIPGGTVTDWPQYRERSLMLDVGREFMPLDVLRAQIRRMGDLKLNVLHLHLSDSFGFRLASERRPEITAAQHYSKQDIRDLIDYAARNQVEIVPEVDFPGHMNGILAAYPELKLRSRDGTVSDAAVDLSDPRGYELMRDILEEFVPLFPGRYWHLGGDEFLLQGSRVATYDEFPQLGSYARATYGPQARPADVLLGLINWGADIVRAHGKRPRIWNDGLRVGEATLALAPDIVIDYWSKGGTQLEPLPFFGSARTPADLVAAGHDVRNATFAPTYYVTGGDIAKFNVPPMAAYELWDPTVFVDGTRLPPEQLAHHLGAGLLVWCDDPTAQTPQQISVSITMPLAVQAQLTWRGARAGGYAEFADRVAAVGLSAP
ncbi:family 20 glycosylhydrolase [Nocardia sp. NPDC052566]|uniref:family 20 glycosylhydrolase n=1 Tax=Nocardia sp. NPDC052566 TaxID=3364330 RepID=UPI0037C7F4E9